MKKLLLIAGALSLFCACQESLENRAARELSEFTKKNCPTPVVNGQSTDSATFEPSTRTIHYYYKLHDQIDNAEVIAQHRKVMRAAILKDLTTDTHSKAYKDAGFNFRYTYRSASQPDKVLLDETFSKKDYK